MFRRQMQGRQSGSTHRRRFTLPALLFLALAAAACGQVITVTPTPTPEPTPTIDVALALATPPDTPTPAPYTPEPTATPTITPTPVLYVIQSGESLGAIAERFNVSVAALQEANGILDPRTLQIGQELVIPGEEESASAENATPTPTPMPLTVENVHLSDTAIGGLWVMGEVFNSSDIPLEQVRVGVTLVDAANGELDKADGLVALEVLAVGERAPFAVLFGSAPPEFERYRVDVLSAVPGFMGSYYRDLEIRDLTGGAEGVASYLVSGRVYNYGPEEAVDVQVVLTAYDPLDRVIAMRVITPEYNVAPVGGETEFSALLSPIGGPVARVAAVAQGRRISAVPQPGN